MSLSFTFIDLLVLGVVVVSAFYAGYRSLVSETLTMFAWVAAALAPCVWRPDLTTTTGLARVAARAADMNFRAFLIDST